jgi:hypothetical protein
MERKVVRKLLRRVKRERRYRSLIFVILQDQTIYNIAGISSLWHMTLCAPLWIRWMLNQVKLKYSISLLPRSTTVGI